MGIAGPDGGDCEELRERVARGCRRAVAKRQGPDHERV